MEASKQDIACFKTLISSHEEWLMSRILEYAETYDFTRYTSTLAEAWRVSIEGLSRSLLELMELHSTLPELHPDEDYTSDPAAAFGMLEAQRHRSRGVNLAMFLALFKYYRQSYHDLLQKESAQLSSIEYFSRYIDRFFDRTEIAYCTEWAGLSSEKQIQELSRTNLSMTNEKNKYLTIFDSFGSPAALVDKDGYIENLNFIAEHIFRGKTVPGTHYYTEHKVKEKFEWVANEIAQLIASDQHETSFEKLYEDAGLIFDVKLAKLHDVSKKFVGYTVLMNDITRIRKAEKELETANEKLKELDRLKSMFIASMSHELRTPLNSIIGFTGIILQGLSGKLTEIQREQLTRVKKSGEHLLSLITDVIDISKIEAGRVEAEPTAFILNELLCEVKDEMDIVATPKQLQIVIDISGPIQLYTDRRRLLQCLLNYVSNAVKFTDRAGIIEIKVVDYGNEIEISVKDNGIGISQENISKLFEAFERLESHLKVKAGGTGLGLYLTKKITQNLLLGEVYVRSATGEGSTFGLRIPKDISVFQTQEP